MAPGGGRGGAAGGAGKARAATVVPAADAGSPPSKTRGHRAFSDVLCASLWADFSAGVGHSALAGAPWVGFSGVKVPRDRALGDISSPIV